MEVSCRRFALASGVEQPPDDFTACIRPADPALQRKGLLALITEPYGDPATLSADACRLAQQMLVERYFADNSLSITTALLNALDHANNELLQQNYAPDRLAADGTYGLSAGPRLAGGRSKRARVGVTAVISRPDGTGIYLSQLAPTQAYLYHNGAVQPLPEPPHWRQHKRPVVTLRRVGDDEEDDEWEPEHVPVLDAPPLGSGPGVLADLLFRRVEPGDTLVLTSTGLSRHITREWAEETIPHSDPDTIVSALHDLALEHGLAQAHGMVVQLGVATSSGVDEHIGVIPGPTFLPGRSASDDSLHEVPPVPPAAEETEAAPDFIENLRTPAEWANVIRDAEQEAEIEEAAAIEPDLTLEQPAEWEANDEAEFTWSAHPTGLFVQSEPPVPPYLAEAWDAEPAVQEPPELPFDGWEDNLPGAEEVTASDHPAFVNEPEGEPEGPTPFKAVPRPVRAVEHVLPPAPRLFEDEAFAENPSLEAWHEAANHAPASRLRLPRLSLKLPALPRIEASAALRGAAHWASTTGRALLPSGRPLLSLPKLSGRALSLPQLAGHALPLRLVIVAALGLVVVLLAISVATMAGGAKQQANENLLVAAQQLETEANQPGLTDSERREKLEGALARTQQALAADPASEEAKLLAGKLQTDLDKLDGITRLSGVTVLFNLDSEAEVAGAEAASGTAAAPISGTLPVQDVVVQSNDLYVLDRTANRVYRCQVSTRGCTAALSGGDTTGGETVGAIRHIALRVGAPVVVDDRMVSYALDPANGSWQAEPLGDAGSLQPPKDIATYDGNLYLLDSRPGQIVKYASGSYGSPPTDWVQANEGTSPLNNPVAIAIDGAIYVLLADGKIVVMQGGTTTQTITPGVPAATGGATDLFTSTDVRDLYVLHAGDGIVTRVSKEGKTLGSFKAPAGMDLDRLSGFGVDEARGKVYLVQGRTVYEGAFGAASAPQSSTGDTGVVVPAFEEHLAPAAEGESAIQPSARPTVEP
ncbi:MAG TPA: hypothetical protein VFR15_05480 [Chloroflexia bacterium]|nr:hypothetical protein [Chloroflexia bacterium]